jgi:hypothetical protein
MPQCTRETDLYAPLKHWLELQQYVVRSEVCHCDIVAMREGQKHPLVIELKKTFTIALLLQALRRRTVTPLVYIAAARPRRAKLVSGLSILCTQLGIGMITVAFFSRKPPHVECHCTPTLDAQTRPSKVKSLVTEFSHRSGDYTEGGQTRLPLVSAYREKALKCAYVMHTHGMRTPRDIVTTTQTMAAPAIVRNNVYGWFARTSRGQYALTDAGVAALDAYAHVVAAWSETIDRALMLRGDM